MPLELTAKTEPGARLVALAEDLARAIAVRAAAHDREASYPYESIAALARAGYLAAPIPPEHGGMGVASVHDVVVAAGRLARGDASVAIGVNMHMAVLRNIVRQWEVAVAEGRERRMQAIAATLRAMASENAVVATAVSEPGQDLTRPATTATRTDSGWRIDGRKIFCTMSPAATVLYTSVRFADDDGAERYGYARVPSGTPGLVIHDDWDALGMRASGSHSVTFDGVELPRSALGGGFPVGSAQAYMETNLTAGLFHASASLGIAESAQGIAAEGLRARNGDARGRMLLAESAVELTGARGALARAATLIDDHYAGGRRGDDGERVTAIFAEAQATKTFVNEAAVRIVDRALALSGGAGYLNGHPLARAYRDVRAGAFMHPLGANRAYEFVGEVALGREPALH
jgi:alkylation response protein AidB-like acyl-CoA dehydrogenase